MPKPDQGPTAINEQRLTYLLTPWCRVLLERLTGLQLVRKFPAFHGTRRFITALTSVRHLSLSWASPNQSLWTPAVKYLGVTLPKVLHPQEQSHIKDRICPTVIQKPSSIHFKSYTTSLMSLVLLQFGTFSICR